MSRLHILQQNSFNNFDVVVHAPTPAGNNSAGVAWSDALKNSGLAVSSMVVGNGPGQITTAENNNVVGGTVIEARFVWGNNPAWTQAERNADLALRANQAVQSVLADYQQRLAFFGLTVA